MQPRGVHARRGGAQGQETRTRRGAPRVPRRYTSTHPRLRRAGHAGIPLHVGRPRGGHAGRDDRGHVHRASDARAVVVHRVREQAGVEGLRRRCDRRRHAAARAGPAAAHARQGARRGGRLEDVTLPREVPVIARRTGRCVGRRGGCDEEERVRRRRDVGDDEKYVDADARGPGFRSVAHARWLQRDERDRGEARRDHDGASRHVQAVGQLRRIVRLGRRHVGGAANRGCGEAASGGGGEGEALGQRAGRRGPPGG